MAKGKNTVQVAQELARPLLEELGLSLWDVRFEKEGVNWYLRYFIDKPGGVNINDCTDFSRAVDKLLDEADPVDHSYTLEVCSPGIERQFTRDEHFQQYLGQRVTVRLIRPQNGLREFTGVLLEKHGDQIRLQVETDGGTEETSVQKNETAWVRLYAEF